jgi:hypothetical protein
MSIIVNGTISANGGRGGNAASQGGGGGSGGAIRLVATNISGNGRLHAVGGSRGGTTASPCEGGDGGNGGIRLEAFEHEFSGTTSPAAPRQAAVSVFLPALADRPQPTLRVVSVDGIPLVNPTASITFADITTETNDSVEVAVEARNVPVGVVVSLRIVSENAADQRLDSTPLAGTRALSTATVTIPDLPPGFSRGFLSAEWSEE